MILISARPFDLQLLRALQFEQAQEQWMKFRLGFFCDLEHGAKSFLAEGPDCVGALAGAHAVRAFFAAMS